MIGKWLSPAAHAAGAAFIKGGLVVTTAAENKMGTQPILKLIVTMSLPAIFSMLVQALYNVVDSYFVAKVSQDALTAVSLAFPVQTLMIAFGAGTGIGLNSLVSRRLGEGRQTDADAAAAHGVVLAVLTALCFALLGALFSGAFFHAFTDDAAVFAMGRTYTTIVTVFSFGFFVEIVLEKTLQATGNMIYPMLFQLSGAVINIILDPILIFGAFGLPAMGVAGAAAATVTGQILSMLFALYISFFRSHRVHITLRGFRFCGRTVRDIYAVGIPSIIMQSIMSVLTVGLNKILIDFGKAAVNVLGIYYKLQSFVFMPVFGLTHGVLPIMGYNYGAQKRSRLMQALFYGSAIAFVIMAAGTALFWAVPEWLLGLFEADAAILEIGVPALRIISLSFPAAALGILFSTLFQACGMGQRSLFVSVLRQLVVILPAAYLLAKIGVVYVWYAFPIAECVSFVASILLFLGLYRKHIRTLGACAAPQGETE